MYRQKHGGGSAPAEGGRPVTGPGNTAVFTCTDPATGEETTLFRNSGPGLPPSEYQAAGELRRMGVPNEDILATHTGLRPSLLPGGYTAELPTRTGTPSSPAPRPTAPAPRPAPRASPDRSSTSRRCTRSPASSHRPAPTAPRSPHTYPP
ncbi:nucleic acid/nucleotide deaminase domain-containing protein [Streptomyces sp. NPDC003016]